ncbi:hypothetical protein [Blastococcus saxobsidens]|uniref:Uncharacterized protein n=1 Tax=Blastococcus saxobsidens TaxID=138336 RepID=A0A4Q7YDT9_9ACTN|nr:hypothetical protein [Blastococcus saxobsidens]RZU34435.1 hypothetical protein BKA19_4201 [Blastococcus saxobsidens]
MGRLIAVVLFVALLVPGVLLARAWGLASGQRAVASGAVELAEPTPEGVTVLRRQAAHGRRLRLLGLVLGVAGILVSVVLLAEASVFLWVPILVVGLLAGVLLAEATRPRPRWALSAPPRRPRLRELVSGWLVWTMRAVVLAELAMTAVMWRDGDLGGPVVWAVAGVPLVAWLTAEVALLRVLVRPLPAEGADVPVDEALRTWTAHLVTAAASVTALLPFGTLLLRAGLELGDQVTQSFDVLPVGLVAGGFSALAAGLAVGVFLLGWLRPVRSTAPALAN